MKMKQKLVAAITVVAVLMSTLASSATPIEIVPTNMPMDVDAPFDLDSNNGATPECTDLPFDYERVIAELERQEAMILDENGRSQIRAYKEYLIKESLKPKVEFDASKITIEHLPIGDDLIAKGNELLNNENVPLEGMVTTSMTEKGQYMPTRLYNLASSNYTGTGTFTNSYIWSEYYFMPNSSNQIHFYGSVGTDYRTYTNLLIQIVNVNDKSYTDCYISPIYTADGHTIYNFDFLVGPLNGQQGYCIKVTPTNAINQHSINFAASHR